MRSAFTVQCSRSRRRGTLGSSEETHEHSLGKVSDSTLRFDRDVKVPLYTRHRIPEVWIVDLQHDRLHLYRTLRDGEYRDEMSTSAPAVTPIEALPQFSVDLSRLL